MFPNRSVDDLERMESREVSDATYVVRLLARVWQIALVAECFLSMSIEENLHCNAWISACHSVYNKCFANES